jgi:hypothetical protein
LETTLGGGGDSCHYELPSLSRCGEKEPPKKITSPSKTKKNKTKQGGANRKEPNSFTQTIYFYITFFVHNNKKQQWTVITIPKNRFCWSVMVQIKDQAEAKEQRFRNSEWGPEANNSLIDDVKDFRITFGGTLGDMIEATPKDRISKVMLEEKLFETWHYRNVVLIGDGKSFC